MSDDAAVSIFYGIMIFSVVFAIAVSIGVQIMCGYITNIILRSRGYYDNWFWWGFFFVAGAWIVAFLRPDISEEANKRKNADTDENKLKNNNDDKSSFWICSCGIENSSYTRICSCGKMKKNI